MLSSSSLSLMISSMLLSLMLSSSSSFVLIVVQVHGAASEVVVAREQTWGPLTWEWRSFVKLRCLARGWRSRAGHTVQAPPAGVHVYT